MAHVRVRRVLLAGLLLLALALGAGSGYYAGDYLDTPEPTASGTAGPLGEISPSPTPTPTPTFPVKTPIPSTVEPLETGLDYSNHTFTVTPKDAEPVQLSIETPQGWKIATRDPKRPGEVKYLDKLRERGVRVEAVAPAEETPADEMAQLIVDLKKSQAPENDVRITSNTTDVVTGDDGESRSVATLIYTFIPNETLRYVIVRWIAINGELTNVEMSITGLPQDAQALDEVLQRATASVSEVG